MLDIHSRPAVKVLYGGMRKFKQVKLLVSGPAIAAGSGNAGRHGIAENEA